MQAFECDIFRKFGFLYAVIYELAEGVSLLGGQDAFEQGHRSQGVIERAVAAFGMNAEVAFQVAQAITGKAGKYLARHSYGAQLFAGVGKSEPGKFFPQKTVIKRYIVGHKNGAFGHLYDLFSHFEETWGLCHHVVGNSGELGNAPGDTSFRVEQGRKCIDDALPVVQNDGNFGNAFVPGLTSGGFYVYNGIHGSIMFKVKSVSCLAPFRAAKIKQ